MNNKRSKQEKPKAKIKISIQHNKRATKKTKTGRRNAGSRVPTMKVSRSGDAAKYETFPTHSDSRLGEMKTSKN